MSELLINLLREYIFSSHTVGKPLSQLVIWSKVKWLIDRDLMVFDIQHSLSGELSTLDYPPQRYEPKSMDILTICT